jgi:hypothetical protein
LTKLIFAGIVAITAWGQTLEISPVTVERGSANIFRIVLDPRVDQPIAALQWELLVPSGLEIEPKGIVTGAAADAAKKSMRCSNQSESKQGRISACILAGGVQEIQAGAIAIVKFAAKADAQPGKAVVRLQRVQGVSADLKRVVIADTNAEITIR